MIESNLRALLLEAKAAHTVFEKENGTDDDWAGWYARYMLKKTEKQMQLPPYLWLDITIHATSDQTDTNAAVQIGGSQPNNIYETNWDTMAEYVCDLLNLSQETKDARTMTREEVLQYRKVEDGEHGYHETEKN